MKIYILGAGTLGKFIAEIIESQAGLELAGFFDDGYPENASVCGYPVIGKLDDVDARANLNLAIGIGDTKWRKRVYEQKSAQGFEFPALIHKSTLLSSRCIVGKAVIIGPNSSVLGGSVIGQASCLLSHVNINQDVTVDPYCLIGAGVVVGNNAVLGEGCHIGMANHIKLRQRIEPWTYYNVFENAGLNAKEI